MWDTMKRQRLIVLPCEWLRQKVGFQPNLTGVRFPSLAMASGPVLRIPFSRLDGGIDHNKWSKNFRTEESKQYNFLNESWHNKIVMSH